MAIEKIGTDGYAITGSDVQIYTLIAAQKALKLEIKTGLKVSRHVNISQWIREVLEHNGVKAPRNKVKLFDAYNKFLDSIGVLASY